MWYKRACSVGRDGFLEQFPKRGYYVGSISVGTPADTVVAKFDPRAHSSFLSRCISTGSGLQ